MKIKTNNHWNNFLYGYELTEEEKKQFDYMGSEELECGSFLRYKGYCYSLDDFMWIKHNSNPDFSGWTGYHSNSFFSGVVIKLSDDTFQYQIGTYIS